MHHSPHPMTVAKPVIRIGFGVALALVGIAHYMDAATFAEAVGRGLGTEYLEQAGEVWGYLLPGLMIVGGVLIALGLFPQVGALVAGVALVSIPAGLMLKSVLSGLSLNDTMPPAMNAIVWILFYAAAIRGFDGHCQCHVPSMGATKPVPMVPAARPVPMKAPVAAPKPTIIAKAAPAKKPMPPKKKK